MISHSEFRLPRVLQLFGNVFFYGQVQGLDPK